MVAIVPIFWLFLRCIYLLITSVFWYVKTCVLRRKTNTHLASRLNRLLQMALFLKTIILSLFFGPTCLHIIKSISDLKLPFATWQLLTIPPMSFFPDLLVIETQLHIGLAWNRINSSANQWVHTMNYKSYILEKDFGRFLNLQPDHGVGLTSQHCLLRKNILFLTQHHLSQRTPWLCRRIYQAKHELNINKTVPKETGCKEFTQSGAQDAVTRA